MGGDLPGDPCADLAVILDESLADVVDEQGQKQRPLTVEGPPLVPQPAVVCGKPCRPFDRKNAVLVDGVFVKAIKLQQVAGVRELRDQNLEHPHLVQPVQGVG